MLKPQPHNRAASVPANLEDIFTRTHTHLHVATLAPVLAGLAYEAVEGRQIPAGAMQTVAPGGCSIELLRRTLRRQDRGVRVSLMLARPRLRHRWSHS